MEKGYPRCFITNDNHVVGTATLGHTLATAFSPPCPETEIPSVRQNRRYENTNGFAFLFPFMLYKLLNTVCVCTYFYYKQGSSLTYNKNRGYACCNKLGRWKQVQSHLAKTCLICISTVLMPLGTCSAQLCHYETPFKLNPLASSITFAPLPIQTHLFCWINRPHQRYCSVTKYTTCYF